MPLPELLAVDAVASFNLAVLLRPARLDVPVADPGFLAYFAPGQGLFTIQPAQPLSSCGGSPCPLYMAAVAYNSATSVRVWAVQGGTAPPPRYSGGSGQYRS